MKKTPRAFTFLLIAWTLSMIAVPIIRWTMGDGALPGAATLSVALLAAAVTTLLGRAWGKRRTLVTVLVILAGAWTIERIGSATGIPFGSYHYTQRLTPQIGHVPLLIPLAWLMLLPPAWAIAAAVAGRWSGMRFTLVAALAFTAWDLFLDPQMTAWGFWVWDQPGGYFGIPWVNFGGWMLSAALLTWAARPLPLPMRPLLIVYALTWALQTVGLLVFWRMPGPALAGAAGMGLMLALALRRQGATRFLSRAQAPRHA
ncbi:MAG: carotenoid biosynthesis protein [Caldilineaceae bacterium]|nr:carotenoid biosynthesis protein [Caldilineaceae bacterium]